MDALNALYSVTYEIDEKRGTPYHARFKAFLTQMQQRTAVIDGLDGIVDGYFARVFAATWRS